MQMRMFRAGVPAGILVDVARVNKVSRVQIQSVGRLTYLGDAGKSWQPSSYKAGYIDRLLWLKTDVRRL